MGLWQMDEDHQPEGEGIIQLYTGAQLEIDEDLAADLSYRGGYGAELDKTGEVVSSRGAEYEITLHGIGPELELDCTLGETLECHNSIWATTWSLEPADEPWD